MWRLREFGRWGVVLFGLVTLIAGESLLSCSDAQSQPTIGATTPFTTMEAESGTLVGGSTVVALTSPPTTAFSSPQLEASGHAYVSLTGTGQSITWTNSTTTTFTGINIRFCIPDASGGGGTTATLDLYVNGVFKQAITLNSAQEWVYENTGNDNGQSKSPSYGKPHKFWDDIHLLISGSGVAPGSTIALKKDSTNTAAFYYIDCVDLEAVPAALTQPANSLSVTSYGAVANNAGVDSTTAIQNCINAAQSSGKIVWVPAGVFFLKTSGGITATGVTIAGAGPWYSTIYHSVPLPSGSAANMLNFTSCTVQNLNFDANAPSRANGAGGGLNPNGSNWVIDNVWLQHVLSGVWARGSGGIVRNSRILSTWADGININNDNYGGSSDASNSIGNNLTVQNNFIRGSGDDSISLDSTAGTYNAQMNNCTIINNTTVAPWWMNNLAVYGGNNDVVKNNLMTDSVKNNGMNITTIGSDAALQSGVFQGNTVLRGGSYGFGVTHPGMAIGNVPGTTTNSINSAHIDSNMVINSMFEGIHVYQIAGNIVVQNNLVTAPGTTGVIIDSGSTGYGVLNDNLVSNLGVGRQAFVNSSSSFNLSTTDQVTSAPIQASSYNTMSNLQTGACPEGGLNLSNISNGSYSEYNSVNLNGATTLAVRVACGGSTSPISVHLDSPTGTVIGTGTAPNTGGWSTYATISCALSGASGYHNVYLVYGGAMNVEWFDFQQENASAIVAIN